MKTEFYLNPEQQKQMLDIINQRSSVDFVIREQNLISTPKKQNILIDLYNRLINK